MSDYPTLKQSSQSAITVAYDIDVSYAENGTIRAITFDPTTAYNASIVHEFVNKSDRDLILNHYDLNKSNSFYLLYDADNFYYKLAYSSKPKINRKGIIWNVTSSMMGVKIGLTINLVNVINGANNVVNGINNVINTLE